MPSYSANVTLTFNTRTTCSANNPQDARDQILDSLNLDQLHLEDFDLDVNVSLEEQRAPIVSGYTSMSSLLSAPQETISQTPTSYVPLRRPHSGYTPLHSNNN